MVYNNKILYFTKTKFFTQLPKISSTTLLKMLLKMLLPILFTIHFPVMFLINKKSPYLNPKLLISLNLNRFRLPKTCRKLRQTPKHYLFRRFITKKISLFFCLTFSPKPPKYPSILHIKTQISQSNSNNSLI